MKEFKFGEGQAYLAPVKSSRDWAPISREPRVHIHLVSVSQRMMGKITCYVSNDP